MKLPALWRATRVVALLTACALAASAATGAPAGATPARINGSGADVVWVGLSTPKQEYWMANHAHLFPRTMLVGVGGALDFFAGLQRRAPAWMQSAGLEWLFRLAQEPQRLWPRYRQVVPGMLRIMIAEAVHR